MTGPNGYGKATVLKIIDALATQNRFFFIRLLFHKIALNFDNKEFVIIEKRPDSEVSLTSYNKSSNPVFKSKSRPIIWNNKSILNDLDFVSNLSGDRWIDKRTNELYSTDYLLQKVMADNSQLNNKLTLNNYPKLPSVYFIREQRLLSLLIDDRPKSRHTWMSWGTDSDGEIGSFTNAIEIYARELREKIKETLAKSSQINHDRRNTPS